MSVRSEEKAEMAGQRNTARPTETIARSSLADRVVALLRRSITDGCLTPGTRLPTGQQMTEQYGVSLMVIREAISSLRADGLIESRQGAGVFVAGPGSNQPFRIQPLLSPGPEAVRKIFELRMSVEASAAGLAATRAKHSQIITLRRVHQRMSVEAASGSACIEEALSFHRAIAEATNNELFVEFIIFLGYSIRESIRLTRSNNGQQKMPEVLAEHAAILDAICTGDAAKAQAAAMEHMTNSLNRCVKT
jgi:GntR family transcriptional repressor for pyruvate dehydrogenase complex